MSLIDLGEKKTMNLSGLENEVCVILFKEFRLKMRVGEFKSKDSDSE